MSRAVRRQQQAAPKEGAANAPRRTLGIRRPRTARGAKTPVVQRRRLRAPAWISDIWSELKKVTWPTREETMYLTSVVIVVAVSVGIVLGGIDIFFNWLIDRLLLQ